MNEPQQTRRPGAAERDAAARAALAPLAADERPAALIVAIVVAVVLAAAVLVGALTVPNLHARGGSLPAATFLTGVFLLLARGMYAKRYWAVLGFEALIAFQVIVSSLALVVAATILAAAVCLVMILFGGWLFYKLIRVMGRIQVTDALAAGGSPDR